MREIKFRGLRTDGKGWAYGYYWIDNTSKKYKITTDLQDDNFVCNEIIPETVGQFTGLTDKNGKEIYEGDVFTSDEYPFKDDGKRNYDGVVEWIFAGFQYVLKCVNKSKMGISDGVNNELEEGGWLEVIGNIHEKNQT